MGKKNIWATSLDEKDLSHLKYKMLLLFRFWFQQTNSKKYSCNHWVTDVPGGAVVKTLCSQYRGKGLIPGQGSKMGQAIELAKRGKKKQLGSINDGVSIRRQQGITDFVRVITALFLL